VTHGGGWPLAWVPESYLAHDDCVIDGAEGVVLDDNLVRVASMSVMQTTRVRIRTHREDQSSIREHIIFHCLGG
jgi:hypothetical protein